MRDRRWMSMVVLPAAMSPAWGQASAEGSGEAASSSSIYFRMDAGPGELERRVSESNVLEEVSTFHVAPPSPREFRVHDLITIVVDETVRTSNSQSLETEREFELESQLNSLIDAWELLELRLRAGNTQNLTLADVDSNSEFEGTGEAETTNRFTARITATVVDVKPNGTLVLQARRVTQTDDVTSTITLSGIVRKDDVTDDNTVRSTQIANMELKQEQTGSVRDAAKKGLVAKVLEALFAF